ncbi:MAG: hypothetical protein DYH08_14010 [Actinobacteria bacterium ATB1]|nr:hypothetical protein [Actinobacteria bacterium ATB1]
MGGDAGVILADVKVGMNLPELHYDVTATTVILGALASRDTRPMHHDRDFAQQRNGVRDIFMNTPNQAAWFERFVTDWTGPKGRLGRMKFRMRDSVFAGDEMVMRGRVTDVGTDDTGCAWVSLEVTMSAVTDGEERIATTCDVRVAIPVDEKDNPWRHGTWRP